MQIEVRSRRGTVTPSIRQWAERRIRFAVGQFGAQVRKVRGVLSDENGPKGGVDKRCQLEARCGDLGVILAEVRDTDVYAAISRAAERLGRRVRTAVERKRAAWRMQGQTRTVTAKASERRRVGAKRLTVRSITRRKTRGESRKADE